MLENERSQLQNRMGAMKILKARLYEVEQKKKEAEFNAIVEEKTSPGAARSGPMYSSPTRWSKTTEPATKRAK
ncbi:MAG: hypothetical protein U0412_13695 [Nitrospira sp.]